MEEKDNVQDRKPEAQGVPLVEAMKFQRTNSRYGAAAPPVIRDVGRQWKTPPEPLMRL